MMDFDAVANTAATKCINLEKIMVFTSPLEAVVPVRRDVEMTNNAQELNVKELMNVFGGKLESVARTYNNLEKTRPTEPA